MYISLPKKIILLSLVCAVFSQTAVAKKMYRWQDESGKWIYSDQVPPSQIQHKRETLNKNAQVIAVTDKPKTKDEIVLEKRLKELKQQQDRIIAAQKTHDKMLLSSFLNIETMIANHNSKIKALDSQEKEKQEAVKKLEENLVAQRKEAATFDIGNKKIPPALLQTIEEDGKKIAQLKAEIADIQAKKLRFNKTYAADKERFEFLTSTTGKANPTSTGSGSGDKALNQLGLFTCDTAEQCDTAWKIAKDFVKTNSTTKLNVDSDKLVMTDDPVRAADLSLSASKTIGENNKQQIFLDIRCVETVQGKEICGNPKAESLRVQFSNYLRSALGLK